MFGCCGGKAQFNTGGSGGGGGAVSSVFGRTGAVVAEAGDYSTDLVANATSSFPGATTLSQVLLALLGPVTNQAGAAYQLALGDAFVRRSHGSACTCVVPDNATVAFPVNTVIVVEQSGAGALTIVAAGGVTINRPASRNLVLTEQFSQVALKKIAADEWELIGDLGPMLSATSPLQLIAGVLSILAVANTHPGVAPQHAGAADVGKALVVTATGSQWSTNFGANTLQTSGGFVSLAAAPRLQLGLAPGSGAGSAASVGDIRLRNNVAGFGPFCYGRDNADGADVFLWGYDSSGPGFQIGNSVVPLATVTITCTTANVRGTTLVVLGAGGSGTTRVDNPSFRFNDSVLTPVIGQLATAGATGQKLTVVAQTAATTGGALDVGPGAGATAGGLGRLMNGALNAQRFGWNDTGIGFYTTAPVAQAVRVGQLTDSTTGTPGGTVNDVGGAFNQATLNNNFASILQRLNALELAIHNIGLTA